MCGFCQADNIIDIHLASNIIDVIGAKLLPCQPVLRCFSDAGHCDKKCKAADMLQHF